MEADTIANDGPTEAQKLRADHTAGAAVEDSGNSASVLAPAPAPQDSGNTFRLFEDVAQAHDTMPIVSVSKAMVRFTLYETRTRFYVVGANADDTIFRVLKIDRTVDVGELSLTEDDAVYNRRQVLALLGTIEDGNKSTGFTKLLVAWGIVGFIRFTAGYYMSLITKRSIVALIGGHYVYHVDETQLLPIMAGPTSKLPDRNSEEGRYLSIFQSLDLGKTFYFSYTYDITNTLQNNIIRTRAAAAAGPHTKVKTPKPIFNEMFVWNDHLLQGARTCLKDTTDWCLPIIHGFIDQAKLSVFGRAVYITLIARRSHFFAGARFLKRGVNDKGYVANEVETEQIVSDMLTMSFHSGKEGIWGNPRYTSYVQHRGSIPLNWSQDVTNMSPKPPIEINVVDPFYSAAALHFDDMFGRYGAPCVVLNLVKERERTPRESLLLTEFTACIEYLNQFLEEGRKIQYIAWDMSRASKSRDQEVILTLERIAEQVLEETGFFHNGGSPTPAARAAGQHIMKLQHGVVRTNCIDCLDRTNAAQFMIGKRALGHQLHALGIIDEPFVAFDTDAVNLLTEMFHDHGDTIALQYGGSHLVNTVEGYRKINQWSSHSRDMIEAVRRFYSNSFVDATRQEAINLFLGNFRVSKDKPKLWDLTNDYHLHHHDPRLPRKRRDYQMWWTPNNLKDCEGPPAMPKVKGRVEEKVLADHWTNVYKPVISSFQRVFAYNVNSSLRYLPPGVMQKEGREMDISPFKIRAREVSQPKEIEKQKEKASKEKSFSLHRWLIHADPSISAVMEKTGSFHDSERSSEKEIKDEGKHEGKVTAVDNIVHACSQPTVNEQEMQEYERYISYPQAQTITAVIATSSNKPHPEFTPYVDMATAKVESHGPKEEDLAVFQRYLDVPQEAMKMKSNLVSGIDSEEVVKKKYTAYQSWLKGRGMTVGKAAVKGGAFTSISLAKTCNDGFTSKRPPNQRRRFNTPKNKRLSSNRLSELFTFF
ncbi:hypothetical protein G7K_1116-t1 [Saitoella complicata NRRL Y-17804]|uniref:SAC domain-containing protein n=1 Tax=Saitoella complicata (strain BCRC 22490 / CBS 7301 / JCM 7358 / NBRC 10748 / NRRL Y-17804) TaxID=698492 RepID=A0A0E9NAS7_SAICN|nr:hypothetical protein G7K_1116-t1 [Saitoella complicata NRRL Y-17804]